MTSPVRAPRPTPRRIAPEPAPDRRSHLRVVPQPAKSSIRPSLRTSTRPSTRPSMRRRRTGAVLSVAVVLIFGSLMASAIFHGLLVSGQSNLDKLDTQIQDEQAALAREKLELADRQSPGRIAEEAAKLGMVPAESQHWLSPGTGADPVVTGAPTGETVDPDQTDTDQTTDTDSTTDPSADELATSDGGAAAQ